MLAITNEVKIIRAAGCASSKCQIPVGKEMLLQFSTNLLGNEIRVIGYPVWIKSTEQICMNMVLNF